MRVRARTALAVAGLLAAAGPLTAQEIAPPPRAVAELTAAYQLRNAAAADVAAALHQHLGTSGRAARVSFDAAANNVIVQASVATHGRVAELVAGIDAPKPQHLLNVVVARVPRAFLDDCGLRGRGRDEHLWTLTERELRMVNVALRNARDRDILSRPQIQVLDNQSGFVQVGQVVGEGTGLTLRLTPRQSADGKTTLIRAEAQLSMTGQPVRGLPGAPSPFNVETMQTTWIHPAGTTGLIAVPTTDAAGKPADLLIFVTPTRVAP